MWERYPRVADDRCAYPDVVLPRFLLDEYGADPEATEDLVDDVAVR